MEIPVNSLREGSLGRKGLALPWQKQRLGPAAPMQNFATTWDDQTPPPNHFFLSAGDMRQHIYEVCQK